jgi:hypothetical protein
VRYRAVKAAIVVVLSAAWGAILANGCSAAPATHFTTGSGGSASTAVGSGGAPTTTSTSTSQGSQGGGILISPDAGDASDAVEEVMANPCGSQCGSVELCDQSHLGLDDNCDGIVDEGCPCTAGQAHSCFKGDPSYHNAPGCYDGTQICTEQGTWGPCVGGVHAVPPDNCYLNDTSACHAITSPPYASVHLKTGTGNFSANATPGSESYSVACPMGVSQCPTVVAPDKYTPLQSGEYTVTYTKTVQGDPNPKTCTFPLVVGARGLRVELSWEHTTADDGVDLDLHVHKPADTSPWGITPGVPQDCTWSNCVFGDLQPPQSASSPHWFPDTNMVPKPVNWDLDPTPNANTCYNDPRGVGTQWAGLGMGCHNPRLDVDNINCDYAVTDPNDASFCTPENINIDYPPSKQWTRIGVHYYSSHNQAYDVHPEVKIFCNGALAADLGPKGYYVPERPITFAPGDGAGNGSGNRFWMVADVAFTTDMCGKSDCVVEPVFGDVPTKFPVLTTDTVAQMKIGPAYPPPLP